MNPQRPTAFCLAAACGLLVALGLTRAVHAAPPVVVSEGDVHVFQLSFDGSG